jgi:pSer/pThr/pTyr-binding forkhead associated (FHA) protein
VFKLTIEDDEGKTTVVPLARDEITIGRLEGNTIRLTERNVSRRHARLVRQNGALYIEDLASFTGVRVNGAKIATPTPLRDGDEVQIGDYKLALKGDRTTAAITDRPLSIGDRPTMPNIPAVTTPISTVGGSVAIPTRASVAAMAAQPAAPAPAPAVPAEITPVDTAPLASGGSAAAPAPARESTPAPVPILTPPAAMPAAAAAAPAPAPAPSAPAVRRSQPQPLSGPAPQPLAAPAPLGGHTPAYRAATPAAARSAQPQPSPPTASRPASPVESVPAVPDVTDAQPTIPIRALGDTVPDRTAGTAPARMFVLTTDLAGMEFTLDRASLVIGRTDENDIVLGHRSISRHHAKVVRDGDHYTIIDMQSSNGVRVNGEDYERIELNPGDIVELGHVKLRFVGPLETFVFKPASMGLGMPSKLLFYGGAALVLATFAFLMVRKRNAVDAPPVVASAPAPEPAQPPPAPAPATAPAPAAAGPGPLPAPPASTPSAIFAEARQAATVEDWDKSRATLDRLATVEDPALRRDAAALRHRVDIERQGSMLFAQFDEASSAKRYAEAMDRYEQIPADSVYKRRAKTRYDEARTLLVSEHMAVADKARTAGHCAEVKTEVAEIVRLDPRNTIAKEMVRLCRPAREPVAARPAVAAPVAPLAGRPAKPRPSPTLTATEAPPRAERAEAAAKPAAPAASEGEAADPDALMKQAREAWLKQQCGAAVDLSRKALHAKPGMTDAYQIIAVCSCTLKDADAAGRAYAKLDDKNRNLVRALCQKNGVTVGGGE